MPKKIVRIICYFLAVLLFIIGAFIFIYPLANKYTVNKNAKDSLESFQSVRETIEEISNNTELVEDDPELVYKKKQYDSLYYDLQSYNEEIYKNGQDGLKDAWSYEQASIDLSNYGIYSNIIAEIKIPKMNVDLPVYLGATWNNMGKGVAQLGQTSMPIGGQNTNCVIAGHRGSSGGKFFLDIEKLEIGDKVYIDNLWETLIYKVHRIEIIKPSEIDKVLIEDGKDMVTLITCHPYPYNYRRYVVYCERSTNDAVQQETNETIYQEEPTPTENIADPNATETIAETEPTNASQTIIMIENISYIAVPVIIVAMIIFIELRISKKKK